MAKGNVACNTQPYKIAALREAHLIARYRSLSAADQHAIIEFLKQL
jgi:hypothetical protein